MNIHCWWYRTKLAAYASKALPEKLAVRIEAHLARCPECTAELTASLRLGDALRLSSPAIMSPNPYLWERLEAAIAAEVPAPRPAPLRRLAPLGGVALAGVALAAVVVVRPALLTPERESTTPARIVRATPAPQVVIAKVELPPAVVEATRREKLDAPVAGADPFMKAVSPTPQRRPTLPKVVRYRSSARKARKSLPAFSSGQAVALVEVGTQRVVEVVHTEALNRMVMETEKVDIEDKSRRAICTPTEATTLAQNTRSLFQ